MGEASDRTFSSLFTEIILEFDQGRSRQGEGVLIEDPSITGLKKLVRHTVENSAIKKATVPPDFEEVVNTDEIKNAGGGPDVVTRITMVLREEGLEWVTEFTHDGEENTRLMME